MEDTNGARPMSCDDIFNNPHYEIQLDANPDVAGIGIIVAFLVTACSVLFLAIVALVGGCLPEHFLRRVDRQVLHANSRNIESKWRIITERAILSLSDQQLVTGLSILIAGYYEMSNFRLSYYHWRIVIYLAWMSSSVHIGSLTILKDVLNDHKKLRNLRVFLMLNLLFMLAAALWPTRHERFYENFAIPAKCFWHRRYRKDTAVDPDIPLSYIFLLGAYIWKLGQLFDKSRGLARLWLRAKPEAATERLLQRWAEDARLDGYQASSCEAPLRMWLRRLRYKLLLTWYVVFVVYAELAESFLATVLYLVMSLVWGMLNIFKTFSYADDMALSEERTVEMRLTFGQLVPLFLLLLPVLLIFELLGEKTPIDQIADANGNRTSQGIVMYDDLTSLLKSKTPSDSQEKVESDQQNSADPMLNHLMLSKAVRVVIWSLLLVIVVLGLAVFVVVGLRFGNISRAIILTYGGIAGLFVWVPLVAMVAVAFSKRLQ